MTKRITPTRHVNYDPTSGLWHVRNTCKQCGGPIEYSRRNARGRKIEYCSPQCINDHLEEIHP